MQVILSSSNALCIDLQLQDEIATFGGSSCRMVQKGCGSSMQGISFGSNAALLKSA